MNATLEKPAAIEPGKLSPEGLGVLEPDLADNPSLEMIPNNVTPLDEANSDQSLANNANNIVPFDRKSAYKNFDISAYLDSNLQAELNEVRNEEFNQGANSRLVKSLVAKIAEVDIDSKSEQKIALENQLNDDQARLQGYQKEGQNIAANLISGVWKGIKATNRKFAGGTREAGHVGDNVDKFKEGVVNRDFNVGMVKGSTRYDTLKQDLKLNSNGLVQTMQLFFGQKKQVRRDQAELSGVKLDKVIQTGLWYIQEARKDWLKSNPQSSEEINTKFDDICSWFVEKVIILGKDQKEGINRENVSIFNSNLDEKKGVLSVKRGFINALAANPLTIGLGLAIPARLAASATNRMIAGEMATIDVQSKLIKEKTSEIQNFYLNGEKKPAWSSFEIDNFVNGIVENKDGKLHENDHQTLLNAAQYVYQWNVVNDQPLGRQARNLLKNIIKNLKIIKDDGRVDQTTERVQDIGEITDKILDPIKEINEITSIIVKFNEGYTLTAKEQEVYDGFMQGVKARLERGVTIAGKSLEKKITVAGRTVNVKFNGGIWRNMVGGGSTLAWLKGHALSGQNNLDGAHEAMAQSAPQTPTVPTTTPSLNTNLPGSNFSITGTGLDNAINQVDLASNLNNHGAMTALIKKWYELQYNLTPESVAPLADGNKDHAEALIAKVASEHAKIFEDYIKPGTDSSGLISAIKDGNVSITDRQGFAAANEEFIKDNWPKFKLNGALTSQIMDPVFGHQTVRSHEIHNLVNEAHEAGWDGRGDASPIKNFYATNDDLVTLERLRSQFPEQGQDFDHVKLLLNQFNFASDKKQSVAFIQSFFEGSEANDTYSPGLLDAVYNNSHGWLGFGKGGSGVKEFLENYNYNGHHFSQQQIQALEHSGLMKDIMADADKINNEHTRGFYLFIAPLIASFGLGLASRQSEDSKARSAATSGAVMGSVALGYLGVAAFVSVAAATGGASLIPALMTNLVSTSALSSGFWAGVMAAAGTIPGDIHRENVKDELQTREIARDRAKEIHKMATWEALSGGANMVAPGTVYRHALSANREAVSAPNPGISIPGNMAITPTTTPTTPTAATPPTTGTLTSLKLDITSSKIESGRKELLNNIDLIDEELKDALSSEFYWNSDAIGLVNKIENLHAEAYKLEQQQKQNHNDDKIDNTYLDKINNNSNLGYSRSDRIKALYELKNKFGLGINLNASTLNDIEYILALLEHPGNLAAQKDLIVKYKEYLSGVQQLIAKDELSRSELTQEYKISKRIDNLLVKASTELNFPEPIVMQDTGFKDYLENRLKENNTRLSNAQKRHLRGFYTKEYRYKKSKTFEKLQEKFTSICVSLTNKKGLNWSTEEIMPYIQSYVTTYSLSATEQKWIFEEINLFRANTKNVMEYSSMQPKELFAIAFGREPKDKIEAYQARPDTVVLICSEQDLSTDHGAFYRFDINLGTNLIIVNSDDPRAKRPELLQALIDHELSHVDQRRQKQVRHKLLDKPETEKTKFEQQIKNELLGNLQEDMSRELFIKRMEKYFNIIALDIGLNISTERYQNLKKIINETSILLWDEKNLNHRTADGISKQLSQIKLSKWKQILGK